MRAKHIIMATLCTGLLVSGCKSTPQLGRDSIDDVIAAMTLEEKAHLVIGTGMDGIDNGDNAVVGATRGIVPGAAGTTYPVARLGIPAIVLADGPAGLRIDSKREGDSATYYCTHFPIGTLLASTWNQDLVERVGRAIGNEVLEYGADVLLAPALNIQRNPLCGRNFEYYSEDPLVSGKIAASYVRGVQSNGVGTSVKHFALNNQETNRMANDAQVSPRAVREIYTKGFETVVKESDPWTVMSSYNYINGLYASENPELLTTLLRDEWGFKGLVMTDWFGGNDSPAQMRAGNDMLQPGYAKQYEDIVAAVKNGTLDAAVLDRNVKRILELIMKTPRFKKYAYSNKPDLKAHAAVTRETAAEGMVLLKNNDGTLPLKDSCKKVALFGCTSYDFIPGGTGSGNVNRAYTVSLLDGLKNGGYTIDTSLSREYDAHLQKERERIKAESDTSSLSSFMPIVLPEELSFTADRLKRAVDENDVAIITVGRGSGEFRDRTSSNFDLSADNVALIKNICKAFHDAGKKAVVVLNVGGAVETASWNEAPDAILCAWQAGQEGGNSVTDVLSGKAYPSGKLTMTFPVGYQDHASSANFPIDLESDVMIVKGNKGPKHELRNVDYTAYEEDIYVGYRYFDAFDKPVVYPFGYGLSYTTFEYSDPKIKADNGHYTVDVTVRNSGNRPGKEIVQLYVAAPDSKKANKPVKELRAFAKTRELAPGESQTLSMAVDAADLAWYDENRSAWIVDAGVYDFLVGASSRDIKAKLSAPVAASEVRTNNLFKLKMPIKLLKR